MFDPLILADVTESLWLDFQTRRRIRREPSVYRHWQRSHELGVPHDGPRPEDALLRGLDLRTRVERLEPLLESGEAVIERVSGAVAGRDYALLVSDLDGVIVSAMGGGAFAEEAERVRLMAGADWSEATRGTNAIGTAIAERRPVFVNGSAHYARGYHELVCYAAPIHDASGEILGVLDATSTVARANPSIGFGVIAAAETISELLRVRAYSLAGAAVTRALGRSLERMNCPVVLIEPPGRISRVNLPARALLSGQSARTDVRTLFGVSFDELAGKDVCEVVMPANGMRQRLRIEPIESSGRLIALLTFLEPLATHVPPKSRLASPQSAANAFSEIFAEDAATKSAIAWTARIAPSDIPIMLLAETGAGKELVARAIHAASRRASGPFVAVNCGSLSPALLESELFGYAPGAFTGAEKNGRQGYLHAASGGTLFLDEVAEMPGAMQAALLRVLETGDYSRIGETRTQHVDVRVVCATCRNLPELVTSGAFRNDLYFRLKGATVTLPPLRNRSDIGALATHLLQTLAERRKVIPAPRLAPAVVRSFERSSWPGNVRELKSTLEVALVLGEGSETIELSHLPPDLEAVAAASDDGDAPCEQPLSDVQGWAVRRALSEVAGNVSLAAKRLGVARSTLYRMMRRHGLIP